jgi:hypothetical protein
MHPEADQEFCIPMYYDHVEFISSITHSLGFTMLITMCFQFSMLDIYHPYGSCVKGTAIMQ